MKLLLNFEPLLLQSFLPVESKSGNTDSTILPLHSTLWLDGHYMHSDKTYHREWIEKIKIKLYYCYIPSRTPTEFGPWGCCLLCPCSCSAFWLDVVYSVISNWCVSISFYLNAAASQSCLISPYKPHKNQTHACDSSAQNSIGKWRREHFLLAWGCDKHKLNLPCMLATAQYSLACQVVNTTFCDNILITTHFVSSRED